MHWQVYNWDSLMTLHSALQDLLCSVCVCVCAGSLPPCFFLFLNEPSVGVLGIVYLIHYRMCVCTYACL